MHLKTNFAPADRVPAARPPTLAGANNTPDKRFCTACLCAIQASLDSITKKHVLAAAAGSQSDDAYRGCYLVLTQALVEGEVLTPGAATALGSDQCRAISQLAPAQRRAACSSAAGAATAKAGSTATSKAVAIAESAAAGNATSTGETRPAAAAAAAPTNAQRSWASLSGPRGIAGALVLVVSLLFTAAV